MASYFEEGLCMYVFENRAVRKESETKKREVSHLNQQHWTRDYLHN
jgi:hypothetical protein